MKRRSFTLSALVAKAHAKGPLALDVRAIGKAFALSESAPVPDAIAEGVGTGEFVAVVEICGPIFQRASVLLIDGACAYLDGYDAIYERFAAALLDPRVGAVVLSIDSPGGDVAGLFDCVSKMLAAKLQAGKPVLAYANECAASAAYALACVADGIYLPASGEVGSVGVLAIHCDESAAATAEGLKFTIFRSGPRKAEENAIEPLTDLAAQCVFRPS